MEVHPEVKRTADNISRSMYRQPADLHNAIKLHAEAWIQHEKKALALIGLGKPGFFLLRLIVHDKSGYINNTTEARVAYIKKNSSFVSSATATGAFVYPLTSFSGHKEDTKWNAIYLVVSCSKDLSAPLADGWLLQYSETESLENYQVLENSNDYVEQIWHDLYEL